MKIRYTHWCAGQVFIRAESQGFCVMRMIPLPELRIPGAVRYSYRLLRRELRRYLKDAP